MDKISKELTIDANLENLDNVLQLVEGSLEIAECPMKVIMQIAVCVEEVFVNVANYAYGDKQGDCTITVEIQDNNAKITLIDRGLPFNPLAKEDPDITLSADERQIGGLGIFMVKKSMDKVFYSNDDGNNIFIMEKSW